MGGCQSGRKVVSNNSKSDLPLTDERSCVTVNVNVPYVLKILEMLRDSQNEMFLCTKFPCTKEE